MITMINLWTQHQKLRITAALRKLNIDVNVDIVIVLACDDDSEFVILEVNDIIKGVVA